MLDLVTSFLDPVRDTGSAAQPGDTAVPPSPRALSEFDVAFCDSLAALEQAYARGLPRTAAIWTMSPALLVAPLPNVQSVEKRPDPTAVARFDRECGGFIVDCHAAVAAHPEIAPLALSVARALSAIQPRILRAAMLAGDDFRAPRALLEVETGDPRLDARFNAPWASLLQANKAAARFPFKIAVVQERAAFGESTIGVADRLRLGGLEKILYRAALKFWRAFPARLSRGTILIRTESEMVRDAALSLALRGFAIRRLPTPKAPTVAPDRSILERLDKVVAPLLRERIVSIAPEECVAPVFREFADILRPALAWHAVGADRWRDSIDASTRAVLVNFPYEGVDETLAEAARRVRAPLITFQHGISLEIGNHYDGLYCQYENTLGDLHIVSNTARRDIAAANPFAAKRCRIAVAGLSSEHCASGRAGSAKRGGAAILFVSTALYRGNVQRRIDAMSDADLAASECAVLTECLAPLPHRVAYKPYPALRYPDPDPVLAMIETMPNIEIVGAFADLRYLVGAHRVIVVSRATSTLSWCLLAGRPLVYIDTDDFYRLRPEAAAAFEAGTFYFDAARTGWRQRLRDFLAQPIAAIEAAWRTKDEARRALQERFFTSSRRGAGRRAAAAIRRRMSEIGHDDGTTRRGPEHAS